MKSMSCITRVLIRECIYAVLAIIVSLSGVLLSYSGILLRHTYVLLGYQRVPGPVTWLGVCNAPYSDKKLSPEELALILEAHQLWLETDAKQGQQAELCGADLSGAHFWGANLRKAGLMQADLRGADLNGADLREANLAAAKLQGADLSETNLSEADLSAADLSAVIFELQPGTLPHIPSLARAQHLSQLRYHETPHALAELREALKKATFHRISW